MPDGSAARVLPLLVLMGCAPPMAGEPCAPGSPLVILDHRPEAFYGWPYPILQCTGPMGCEGPADFRWVMGGGPALTYCGCDGQTRWSDPDFGGQPNVRWRWYGSCEDPCAHVLYDGDAWVVPPYPLRLPAAPHCVPDCTMARAEDGECVAPGGAPMPSECCNCHGAALDDAGQCTSSGGLALPAFCCPA